MKFAMFGIVDYREGCSQSTITQFLLVIMEEPQIFPKQVNLSSITSLQFKRPTRVCDTFALRYFVMDFLFIFMYTDFDLK